MDWTGFDDLRDAGTGTFGDVPSDHQFYRYIEALWDAGFTAGCSTGPLMFCPDTILDRAQAGVFILRGQLGTGYSPPAAPWDSFGDDWSLSDISWAEKWAEGMWEEGLTAGCQASPLLYCPRSLLPKVEASVFGLRMMHDVGYTPPAATGTLFADMTDTGYWGTKWSEQAYRYGLLPDCGVQGGKPLFCPDEQVNRAWAAYLIVMAKNLAVPFTLTQPSLDSPADGSTPAGSQPTLVWNVVSGATWYNVQVADAGTLGGTSMEENEWVQASDACSGGQCSWQVDGALTAGDYDWRVRGRDAQAHLSPWSSVWDFIISLAPSPTYTPTSSPTNTPTNTPTQTSTPTPSYTPTNTPTQTPTPTPTYTPTSTPTPSIDPDGDDDGDGLPNGWEINGYDANNDGVIDIDLPALGADYRHKDIFVEMDYMVRGSATNGLAPSQAVLTAIVAIFNNAPVSNPDGVDGITIHLDLDDQVPLDTDLDPVWTEFWAIKSTYFDTVRTAVYHYMIWADSYWGGTSSGRGFIPGTDFLVTLGGWHNGAGGTDGDKIGTFIHELGHNLGLLHGGNDSVNLKPNYLSVMNYQWQTRGVYRNGGNHYDYQRFSLPNLVETNLSEPFALGGGANVVGYETIHFCRGVGWFWADADAPINWNCDGDTIDIGISVDINNDSSTTTLGSQDNWANIIYHGNFVIGSGLSPKTLDDIIRFTHVDPMLVELTYEQQLELDGNLDR